MYVLNTIIITCKN